MTDFEKAVNEIERLRRRIAELEAELQRVQDVSLRECGIGFVDVNILRPNVELTSVPLYGAASLSTAGLCSSAAKKGDE